MVKPSLDIIPVKKSRAETVREYYLARLEEIRIDKVGYQEPGFGQCGSSNALEANIKLSLFRQGKFEFNNVNTNDLSDTRNVDHMLDILITFNSTDINQEITKKHNEAKKKLEEETAYIVEVNTIYNELKDRFMLTKLTEEEMYDDLQYFINFDKDTDDDDFDKTRVATVCKDSI